LSNFTRQSCPWRPVAPLHLRALIFYTHVSHEPSLGVRYSCRHACVHTYIGPAYIYTDARTIFVRDALAMADFCWEARRNTDGEVYLPLTMPNLIWQFNLLCIDTAQSV
jgi:hypothetical protein